MKHNWCHEKAIYKELQKSRKNFSQWEDHKHFMGKKLSQEVENLHKWLWGTELKGWKQGHYEQNQQVFKHLTDSITECGKSES
jgi:hypothetical protein